MNFSIQDFFSECDQIHRFLRIWSHLLNKSLMEYIIFCTVYMITSLDNSFINHIFIGYVWLVKRTNLLSKENVSSPQMEIEKNHSPVICVIEWRAAFYYFIGKNFFS